MFAFAMFVWLPVVCVIPRHTKTDTHLDWIIDQIHQIQKFASIMMEANMSFIFLKSNFPVTIRGKMLDSLLFCFEAFRASHGLIWGVYPDHWYTWWCTYKNIDRKKCLRKDWSHPSPSAKPKSEWNFVYLSICRSSDVRGGIAPI